MDSEPDHGMRQQTSSDLRMLSVRYPVVPEELITALPCDPLLAQIVNDAREAFHRIYSGRERRLAVVVGPCSIHDVEAALEYAHRLAQLRQRFGHCLELIMRVYFEKPRTVMGWKGFLNDPDLDGSFNIDKGLRRARQLLCDITRLTVPAAVEFLDVFTPRYISDLVAWAAIGARTTESQVHRELASGVSCPIGFKNSTCGDVKVAIDAVVTALQPHHFLTIDQRGHIAIAATTGNPDAHIILRGGIQPNFDRGNVQAACLGLKNAGLIPRLMIDASHANSSKNPANQPVVIDAIADQIERGNDAIMGVMIESYLVAGRQDVCPGKELVYGQSITDGCMDWTTTVRSIERLARAVESRHAVRSHFQRDTAMTMD